MNIFERLFRDTLKPTERELLETDAAWWKDCADHWKAELDKADTECHRLYGHVEILQDLLADIHTQGAGSSSGTARAMAAKAKAGCAK